MEDWQQIIQTRLRHSVSPKAPSHWPLAMATVPELLQLSNTFSLFKLTAHTLAARRQREEMLASVQILCWEVGPSHNPNSYNRGFTKNRKRVSLPSLPHLMMLYPYFITHLQASCTSVLSNLCLCYSLCLECTLLHTLIHSLLLPTPCPLFKVILILRRPRFFPNLPHRLMLTSWFQSTSYGFVSPHTYS